VIMIGMPLTGWLMVSASKTAIPTVLFWTVHLANIPGVDSLAPPAKQMAHTVGQTSHELLAYGLYGLFVLPESLKPGDREPVVLSQLNPVGGLAYLVRRYPVLLGMVTVVFLYGLTWQGVNPLFTIYSTYRYAWKPYDIGLFLAALGAMNFAVTTWAVEPITRRLGERTTTLVGMTLQSVALILFGLAGKSWLFWAALPFLCLGSISGPAWQALVSNMVGPSEQGRLAGAFGGMFSIAGMAAPIAFTSLFALEVGRHGAAGMWLGAPFFAATVLSAAALGLAAWATRNEGRAPSGEA